MTTLITAGTGGDFPTIQAAVNAALHGDTVGILDGTFAEAISWNNKFLHLIGLGSAAILTGAGGGAAPTISLTGTGGGLLENFRASNAGSAHADVLSLNVYQHRCHRVRVDGTGGKVCFRAQYLDNCVAYNGTQGFVSSCPGENILRHVTCVNMTGAGLNCSVLNGTVQGCLVYGAAGGSILNYNPETCAWNFVDDAVLTDPASKRNQLLAAFGFVNLGAGDVSLTAASLAYFTGLSPLPLEFLGRQRQRFGVVAPRIYAGAYDPWPTAPAYASGVSSIRRLV